MPDELPIPPVALATSRLAEMIRVWLAKNRIHCVLNIGLWEERGNELESWGILLADLMHHIANAHESEYGRNPEESLRIIRKTFEIEMDHPTSERLGESVTDRKDNPRSERL